MTATKEIPKTAPADDVEWDGRHNPYRPPAELRIPEDLKLHRERDAELDPIEFEVLSSRMWNINEEHADTICRVSGSPVVVENFDFNTCIQVEDGTSFLFAPYIQYFTGAAELIVKYTLEKRSTSPGIQPGDIFISNDPMIAGAHQMDVAVYAPVFIDGALFCWVFNACHARDLGGVEPGGFCVQAPNRYYDPPALRAVKVADDDGIRADIEDTFLHFSRIPDTLALELRSQIAGVVRARTRMQELCEESGPAKVKAVMHKLIDDTERAVRDRLNRLPDGRWSEVAYFGGSLPGDRELHKMVLNLEKDGDQLRFDNFGTDAQIGSINCNYGQLRAGIGCALASMLAYDHRFCVGGAMRVTEIDAEIGTISCADREGAITSTQAQLLIIFMAGRVISKMIFSDPELRKSAMATSSVCSNGIIEFSGIDQRGDFFATITCDHMAGGIGAFSFRDGVDHGGTTFWPKSEVNDVEAYEQVYPILYLYRQAALNCGHGKFRGGNGVTLALVGHRTPDQHASTVSVASCMSTESGLFGGHWGDTCSFYGVIDSNVRKQFEDGVLPGSPEEMRDLPARESRKLPTKTVGHPLGEGDIIEEAVYGAGGYGDPLERDPALVEADLVAGMIRPAIAASVYGVELDSGGAVKPEETEKLRTRMFADRLEHASKPERRGGAASVDQLANGLRISEVLTIVAADDGPVTACNRCGCVICEADEPYKEFSAVLNTQLCEIEPEVFAHPSTELNPPVVYRMFLCPECGVTLENELTPTEAAPFRDFELDPGWVRDRLQADALSEASS